MRQTRSVPLQAKLWGVSTNKVLAFIWSGELSAMNLATDPNGRPRYAIRIADAEAFEKSRQVIPNAGEPTTTKLRRRAAGTVKDFF